MTDVELSWIFERISNGTWVLSNGSTWVQSRDTNAQRLDYIGRVIPPHMRRDYRWRNTVTNEIETLPVQKSDWVLEYRRRSEPPWWVEHYDQVESGTQEARCARIQQVSEGFRGSWRWRNTKTGAIETWESYLKDAWVLEEPRGISSQWGKSSRPWQVHRSTLEDRKQYLKACGTRESLRWRNTLTGKIESLEAECPWVLERKDENDPSKWVLSTTGWRKYNNTPLLRYQHLTSLSASYCYRWRNTATGEIEVLESARTVDTLVEHAAIATLGATCEVLGKEVDRLREENEELRSALKSSKEKDSWVHEYNVLLDAWRWRNKLTGEIGVWNRDGKPIPTPEEEKLQKENEELRAALEPQEKTAAAPAKDNLKDVRLILARHVEILQEENAELREALKKFIAFLRVLLK